MKRIVIIALISAGFFSCKKERLEVLPHGYYTFEHTNHAWGYRHLGWMIDKEGNVMYYEMPAKWNREDTLGYISEAALLENLSYATKFIGKTHNNILAINNKRINAVAKGDYSFYSNMADAGKYEYICYQFDALKNQYKKITVRIEGDNRYINHSSEAQKMYEWMKRVP